MRLFYSALAGSLACISTVSVAAQVPDSSNQAKQINSVPLTSAPLLSDELQNIFMSACFDGSIELPREVETPVTLDDLPPSLRRRFGTPVSGNVWRLNATTPTYLFTMNFEPSPLTTPKICGLVTQSVEIGPAIAFLGSRLNGAPISSLHEAFTGAEWLSAEGGYVAVASKMDSFTVLELKILSKEQQQRALKLVPTLNQGIPAQ